MNGLYVLLSGLGGGALTMLIAEIFRRGKTEAETDELTAKAVDIITKTAVDLVERTTELSNQREQRLELKVQHLEARIDHLSSVVDALSDQLEAAGHTPIIPPMPRVIP